jgi:hypothetical protein
MSFRPFIHAARWIGRWLFGGAKPFEPPRDPSGSVRVLIAGVLAEEAPPWLSKRPMSLSAWKLSDLPCVTLAAVSTEFRCRRKPIV